MVGTSNCPELIQKEKNIMSEYIKVEESYVDALIKNAAWDAAHIEVLTEGDKKGDKSKDKPEDKADFETGARKGDKSNQKSKKGDKPDFTTDQRKGDKSKTHPGRKDFEGDDDDEMKESAEVHEFPLQTLEEESDEDEVDEESDEDEVEEKKASKKESVMKKVKELKKAAKGK